MLNVGFDIETVFDSISGPSAGCSRMLSTKLLLLAITLAVVVLITAGVFQQRHEDPNGRSS